MNVMSKEKLVQYFKLLEVLSPDKFISAQEILNLLNEEMARSTIYNVLDRWHDEKILKKRFKVKKSPETFYKLTKEGVSFFKDLRKQINNALNTKK